MSRLHYTRLLCCRAPLQCCSAGCAGDAAPRSSRPSLAQVSGVGTVVSPGPATHHRYLGLLSQDAAWWLVLALLAAGWCSAGLVTSSLPPQVSRVTVWAAWPGLVCGVRSVLTWAYRIMGTFTSCFLFLYFISTVSEMANNVNSGIKDTDTGHVNVASCSVESVEGGGTQGTQYPAP